MLSVYRMFWKRSCITNIRCLSQSAQANVAAVIQIMSMRVPSTSCPVHYTIFKIKFLCKRKWPEKCVCPYIANIRTYLQAWLPPPLIPIILIFLTNSFKFSHLSSKYNCWFVNNRLHKICPYVSNLNTYKINLHIPSTSHLVASDIKAKFRQPD
jgi:hypothetical protein